MTLKTDEIRRDLWSLKYQRHLQNSHTYLNIGMAFSLGLPAILLAMIEVNVMTLTKGATFYTSLFLLLTPIPFTYAFIRRERETKRKVTSWLKSLDNSNFFKK